MFWYKKLTLLGVNFQDKAPFVSKAEKLKAEYEKKMTAYNRGEKV